MTDLRFAVEGEGRGHSFVLKNFNPDVSRDELALEVGRELVDAAWMIVEGSDD